MESVVKVKEYPAKEYPELESGEGAAAKGACGGKGGTSRFQ